ncbi:DUF2306 domain-containing protein [Catenuloplanes atrovinosus]|uniref:Membrane protein n=1 Tax=Catenuloplanes atrovinosus TaxID=137266 RepID=A0AAE3YJC0_9ACTN|nr:DUF2306 domain-containing protein [Catenuloplanes atrovinosus]MDR7274849.1 putative membrane protein [Catenuloplanes atrovinosus]
MSYPRSQWIYPLLFVIVVFLAFSLPPYLSLDPARSRVPANDALPGQFWWVAGHVLFGSVALFAGALQVWPWLRRSRPALHRRAGRVYVFGGALPAAVTGLVLAIFTPFGPIAMSSSVILALLWFGTTLAGWRAGRQRRLREHRRWMIRSYVLSASIISNRIWGVLVAVFVLPGMPPAITEDPVLIGWFLAGMTTWLGWTVPLLIAEWWLERAPRRPARAPAASAPALTPATGG